MSINKRIYPDNYPNIETIELEKELNLLKTDLVKSAVKDTMAIRAIGQMEILNQLLMIKKRIVAPSSFYRSDSPPSLTVLGTNFLSLKSKSILEIPSHIVNSNSIHDNEGIPLMTVEFPPILEAEQNFSEEENVPDFEKGLTFLPPKDVGKSPYPTEVNKIPDITTFKRNPNFKGRGGLYIGGFSLENMNLINNKIQKINFLSEDINLINRNLAEVKKDFAITGQNTGCWTFGGWISDIKDIRDSIEKITYLDNTVELISRKLNNLRTLSTGTSTPFYSYIFGGMFGKPSIQNEYPFSRNVERMDHLSQLVINRGNVLLSPRSANFNAKGNKLSAFLFGGMGVSWQKIRIVNKFSFLDERNIGIGLSLDFSQNTHASIGNERYIYIVGGEKTQPISRWSDSLDIVTKFDMEEESLTMLGITLNKGRSQTGATNSNIFGYVMGGWGEETVINEDGKIPSSSIEKLFPLNSAEIFTPIGLESQYPNAAFGSISDYGETFNG